MLPILNDDELKALKSINAGGIYADNYDKDILDQLFEKKLITKVNHGVSQNITPTKNGKWKLFFTSGILKSSGISSHSECSRV